ncbi:Amidohydrolase 3 [Kribbella flavida DSM 17836]|uniref:Amidohydrolase 3 n=1 Tax=Kribbella flavida (strain DSM 17836 / JCM 10339 / NBRC 14399) TaxID=479435 RepID=D2PMV8_KRIFD|nr:amidohydrolase [Kribbella flavida]ADB32660.1 Amidohydrolase 3 [Kribbella flavida DSM 17836]
MRTLLTNGSVYSPADPHATAIAFDDGVVSWLGDDTGAVSYASGADEVIDLRGKLVTPAFVDAHVHTAQTGALLTGLDLVGATSLTEALDRLSSFAATLGPDAVIDGAGWDETRWPEGRPPAAEELDRAAGGRKVYLSRVDGHSGVISSALAAAVDGLAGHAGYDASGRVERDAHHAVRDALSELIGPEQRLVDARAAVKAMAERGIGAFHEMAAPHIGPLWELPLVRQAAEELGLSATLYWGEPGVFGNVTEYGLAGLAGDLNADGALGSRTAALRAPYADRPDHRGHAYLTAEQIAEHVVACTGKGVQAGFHCIGDLALDNIARGFELAAEKVGVPALVAARHRLEHVEMPDEAAIATLARCGVVASVQPMFDGHWGGPDGMYAERVGDRWQGMNPFGSLARAGVVLAFGSDAPVTAFGGWQAVRAAAFHHTESERITVRAAFQAHTRGGWRAAGIDDAGVLAPGAAATYAVWQSDAELVVQTPDQRVAAWSTDPRAGVPVLPDLSDEAAVPSCLRTAVGGRPVYESEGWSS